MYINGLHLEQYKQHNYDARDYYLEGLRREPSDIRCNTGMARISYKNGQFEDCVKYADSAIRKLTERNMHPTDTEAMYLKGLALNVLGKEKEAYDILSMAAWDYKFRSAAYFELALLDCKNSDFAEALEKLDTSISYNSGHTKAMNIKALVLSKLGRCDEAKVLLDEIQKYDRLDMFSKYQLLNYGGDKNEFNEIFGEKCENYLDVAYDLINGGFYEDALNIIDISEKAYPLFDYIKAYCNGKLGNAEKERELLKSAEAQDTGYCFPSRLDDIAVLENAISKNPDGDNAYYYLGCLFYDRFAFDKATELWEKCIALNPKHPKAFRNLALSYFDKKGDFLSAKECMETALANKPDDPRLILEYQQILRNMNYSPEYMLDVYDKYENLMLQRDDCYLDKITLKCMVGEYKEGIDMAKHRRFHIYEGGEGKLTKQHAWMHVLYGNRLCKQGDLAEAEKIYKDGINMPKSYGEAKTFFNQEAHIYYYLGKLLESEG
ncbi:MAG TPA: DUF5107 domain-containing protein, partial [Ruminococcus sp.]|nr:DUF5107 domain-containing protein [Ruminococcus sp.]